MVEELYNISPIDGRYREDTAVLSEYFSEYALMKNRVMVELDWFLYIVRKLWCIWNWNGSIRRASQENSNN